MYCKCYVGTIHLINAPYTDQLLDMGLPQTTPQHPVTVKLRLLPDPVRLSNLFEFTITSSNLILKVKIPHEIDNLI